MFSSLPGLLGRDYLIGFFVPAVLLTGAVRVIALASTDNLDQLFQIETAGGVALLFAAWLTSLLAYVFNRPLIRLAEGYGLQSILGYTLARRKDEHRCYLRRLAACWLAWQNAPDADTKQETWVAYDTLRYEFTRRFPMNTQDVLPNSTGNVIRAFEDHARDLYGFEPINGWLHLTSVIPEHFLNELSNAKALVDFWLSLMWLFVLLPVAWVVSLVVTRDSAGFPLSLHIAAIIAPLFFAFSCSFMLRRAAFAWGEQVRAAFDLYLPALAAHLRLEESEPAEQRRRWQEFTRATTHVDPRMLPDRRHKSAMGFRLPRGSHTRKR